MLKRVDEHGKLERDNLIHVKNSDYLVHIRFFYGDTKGETP